MSQAKPATYLTSDLALATTISLNFPIADIDRANPRKAVFVFQRSPELEALVDSYFTHQLKVSPQVFFNQLRDVKARKKKKKRPW